MGGVGVLLGTVYTQCIMAVDPIRMRAYRRHPRLAHRIIIYESLSEGSPPLDRIQEAIDSDSLIFYIHGDHLCQWMVDTLREWATQPGPGPDFMFVIFTDETYYRLRRLLSRNYVRMVREDSDSDEVARQWYDEYEPRLVGFCRCGVYHDGNTVGEGGRAGAGRFG